MPLLIYARDKAIRPMLLEPKSTSETVGERICQELAQLEFAEATKGRGYEPTIYFLSSPSASRRTSLRRHLHAVS
jgi:hypothetical protein